MNNIIVPGLQNVNAIFDTGTTMILGDPSGIADLFSALAPYGAMALPSSPGSSSGYYSSTWANLAANQSSLQHLMFYFILSYILYISQSHATSILPSPSILEGRKSRFPPIRLTSGPYPTALIDALLERPGSNSSLVVSWPSGERY